MQPIAQHAHDGAHVLTLMTVQAHPDDETLWTAGVMARYAAEGLRVACVTCTKGENGEIVAPDLDTPQNHARLGDIRAGELTRALGHLGTIENHWLDYRDSGMMGAPQNDDPESFWKANLDQAAGRLVRIVRRIRPDVMVTFNDFGGNGHPDHIRAAHVAKVAFARAGDLDAYPEQLTGAGAVEPWTPSKLYEVVRTTSRASKVRGLLRSDGIAAIPMLLRLGMTWRPAKERARSSRVKRQGAITAQVDVRPWLRAKRLALGEHRTQIAENRDARRYMATPMESFTLAASRVSTSHPENDLFAGLRAPREDVLTEPELSVPA